MASFVRPDNSFDSRAPRLTRWERDDIGKERRLRSGKYEVIREYTADKLRCPLCFCLPCVVITFILLVLIGIYIVQPYVKAGRHHCGLTSSPATLTSGDRRSIEPDNQHITNRGELTRTQCLVLRQEIGEEGSCSHSTDEFAPCIKIIVQFNTTNGVEVEAVLMENEKTLVHCDKCSFTFGSSDLFARHLSCAWNSALTAQDCWTQYMMQFGQANASYPCYYDPVKTDDVARVLKVGQARVICLLVFLLLFILMWIGGFAFVLYDRFKRRSMDAIIMNERRNKARISQNAVLKNGGNRPREKQCSDYDLETSTMTSINSMVMSFDSTASTPVTRRRRKKKMPCCRPHYQFNYLDEGIVLEEKPISIADRQSTDSFSFLALDTTPTCTCFHTGYENMAFDILPHRDNFKPVLTTNFASRTPGRIVRYLPESIV